MVYKKPQRHGGESRGTGPTLYNHKRNPLPRGYRHGSPAPRSYSPYGYDGARQSEDSPAWQLQDYGQNIGRGRGRGSGRGRGRGGTSKGLNRSKAYTHRAAREWSPSRSPPHKSPGCKHSKFSRIEERYGLPAQQLSSSRRRSPSPVRRYGGPPNGAPRFPSRTRSANRFEGNFDKCHMATAAAIFWLRVRLHDDEERQDVRPSYYQQESDITHHLDYRDYQSPRTHGYEQNHCQILAAHKYPPTMQRATTNKYCRDNSYERHDNFNESKPGRYRKDVPFLPRGKVLRTLFMHRKRGGVASNHAIGACFSTFGEVADVANLLASKKICYVMFFDSRSAEQALMHLDKHLVIDRTTLDLSESNHRPDAMGRPPTEEDYQGTVLISLTRTQHTLSNFDRPYFEEYGDIYRFYPFKGYQNEWVVEYYDARAAQKAGFSNHGLSYRNGTIYTTFLWDEVANEYHQDSHSHDAHRPRIMNRGDESYNEHAQRAADSSNGMRRKARTQRGPKLISVTKQAFGVNNTTSKQLPESTKAVIGGKPQKSSCAKNIIIKYADELANIRAASPNLDTIVNSPQSPGLMQQVRDAKEILKQHQKALGLGTPLSSVMEPQNLASALSYEHQNAALSVKDTGKHELSQVSVPMHGQPLPDVVLQSTPAADPTPVLFEQGARGLQSGNFDMLQSMNEQLPSVPNNDTRQSPPLQQYLQVHEQAHVFNNTKINKSIYESEHSDGISRLLGILGQVQLPDQNDGL
ncbi:hypothetical protein COEREDRAFT_87602 [Coemansia reversa NRRL 1564]|uniref:RRM domain-containing protein n=1 Tax=Coemansia reversa (strain ATCC 12441 / NRRL 1564) TaxID=763665 RepID=A0A2G5B9E9_COERN|nr:hypothetical protein COEREDRAFT_87602 [Coemansia reversa NRRL 1564]|eukprot:PIA15635.1 hypothetical protein COEREDRAFT_87602 [Coemansia reversa NRRL 1564]